MSEKVGFALRHIPSHCYSKLRALQRECVATVKSFKSYDSKRRQAVQCETNASTFEQIPFPD